MNGITIYLSVKTYSLMSATGNILTLMPTYSLRKPRRVIGKTSSTIVGEVDRECDFCMVYSNDDSLKVETQGYVKYLRNLNLIVTEYDSIEGNEVRFVRIQAPIKILFEYANKIDFDLLLDEKQLELLNERWGAKSLIDISHMPDETKIRPFEYISCNYRVTTEKNPIQFGQELYWRPDGLEHPFRELIKLKLILHLIEARVPGGGEPMKIKRYLYTKKSLLAFFPLHNPEKLNWLSSNWILSWHWPWKEPIDDIKVSSTSNNSNYIIILLYFFYVLCHQEYFGERIGLYFVFMSHFMTWLFVPALIGLIFQIVVLATNNFSSPVLPFFGICITLWAITMLEFWKRRECCKYSLNYFSNLIQIYK